MEQPLVLSSEEWNRLEQEAGRHPVAEDAEMQEYLRRLDLGSKKMMATWTGTLEHIKQRKQELPAKKQLKCMEYAELFYKNCLQNEKKKRQQMMESVSEVIFQHKNDTRQFRRASIEAATLKERELQIQFDKNLKEERLKKEEKEYKMMLEKMRKWQQFQKQEKIERLQKDIENQQILIEQINQRKKLNELRMAEERRLELEDLERAKKELEAIEKFENELIAATKQRLRRNSHEIHERANQRILNAQKEHLEDKLTEVVRKSKYRIYNRVKAIKQARPQKRIETTEAISKILFAENDVKAKREQEKLEKAQRVMQEEDDAREEKENQVREQIRIDCMKERTRYLEEQMKREQKERNLRSWSIMNRFKNMELCSEFKRRQEEDAWRRKLELRAELLRLKKEREDREADEQKTLEKLYEEEKAAIKYFDEKIIKYARKLYEEAKENNWPTYPIVKSMHEYNSRYRLWPMPPLPKPLQNIFPKYKVSEPPPDITKPEGGYVKPEDVTTELTVKDYFTEKLPALVKKRNGLDPKVKHISEIRRARKAQPVFNRVQDKEQKLPTICDC